MDRGYYEKFYDFESKHWYFLNRSQIIKNILKKFTGQTVPLKILNVGAATGATSQMLSSFGDVTSVEYDANCANFASQLLGKKVHNCSVTELPFADASFDIVCAFDVLEHVDHDNKGVEEMVRVCKQNGLLYVTVPAFMLLWSGHDEVNHHKRRYLMSGIKNLFKSYKGKSIYSGYFNTLLFTPILLVRLLQNFSRKFYKAEEPKVDFEVVNDKGVIGKLLNRFLGFLFSLEILGLRFFRFPVGVSIIYLWKKN